MQIHDGVWKSLLEIARQMGISEDTVRRAIAERVPKEDIEALRSIGVDVSKIAQQAEDCGNSASGRAAEVSRSSAKHKKPSGEKM